MIYLTEEQALFVHARIISETGGHHGVRHLGMLQSAVGRPRATFEGRELYLDIYSKAAALLDSLVNNHPFVDGNKRTGIVCAGLFLQLNGLRLNAGNAGLEAFVIKFGAGRPGLRNIATWFKKNSEPLP